MTDSSKSITSSTALWNFFKYDDMDSPSNCVMLSKWKFDFSCLMDATKLPRNLLSNWVKVWILPSGREVYHVKATSVRVVGKNLHYNARSVMYNNIRFLYAIKCSSRHDVPSKAAIFGIFIFAGLGVSSTSGASGKFICMGS